MTTPRDLRKPAPPKPGKISVSTKPGKSTTGLASGLNLCAQPNWLVDSRRRAKGLRATRRKYAHHALSKADDARTYRDLSLRCHDRMQVVHGFRLHLVKLRPTSVTTQLAPLAPPNPPWRPVSAATGAGSYVSVYLSSSLGRLPVRDVLKLGDNKSDPNIETLTYGLFSTCEPTMRQSIAARGIREMFFVTTVDGLGRALVGMYDLHWFVKVGAKDFAFAAQTARFIDPIPVAQITGTAGRELQKPLRNYKIIEPEIADDVRGLVTSSVDRTDDYLFEVDRLERMSLSRTGFRYPSWDRVEPFSWDAAEPYLAEAESDLGAPNTSPTGMWRCTACGAQIRNEARLRICNVCHRFGTVEPMETTE